MDGGASEVRQDADADGFGGQGAALGMEAEVGEIRGAATA